MRRTLLVADADPGRAKRIEEDCSARGIGVRCAANGAAALETALADPPDVVVAALDLALIDALRLADILRSNPRTRGVQFVFHGPRGASGPAPGLGDEVLPPDAAVGEIAQRVEALLARKHRVEAVDRASQRDHEVEGRLSQIPLADLLQLFHLNGKTGSIELSRKVGSQEERALVQLVEGNVVHARVGTVEGEKALFRLLAWSEGSFAFSPQTGAVAGRITTPTRALLLEGLRQLDEATRMARELPPQDAHLALEARSPGLTNALHPLTQEVLLLLEIYPRVGDVVDHSSFPDYQVLRTLQMLIQRGVISVQREPSAAPAAASGALFGIGQAHRLREWILRAGGGPGPGLAKVVVLAPDAAALQDFARLLRGVPGARLDPDCLAGGLSSDDLVTFARIAVDAETGLELVHLPAHEAAAALWPVVGHGALGTLVLLSAPVAESSAVLRGACTALRALPRARTFHVMLLRKDDERPLPEEVRENLELFDEASLFLLPIEAGGDSLALLRRVFARILP